VADQLAKVTAEKQGEDYMAPLPLFPATIAGSLPKPAWLAEPEKLWAPWRQQGAELIAAKQDAALVWLKIQEDAGIHIVSEGEQFRIHFVHGFLEHIGGIDWAKKTKMGIRNNRYLLELTGEILEEGDFERESQAVNRMKKFTNYIASGIHAGALNDELRRATTLSGFRESCRAHLDSDELFPDEPGEDGTIFCGSRELCTVSDQEFVRPIPLSRK
jgi:hypothetical protein